MYAAGIGVKPWRANRAGGTSSGRRLLAAVAAAFAVVALSIAFALGARGSGEARYTTVVVQPGDTLWSIAVDHYPADDVRIRVDDIEQANSLQSPTIQVGQSLRLPS